MVMIWNIFIMLAYLNYWGGFAHLETISHRSLGRGKSIFFWGCTDWKKMGEKNEVRWLNQKNYTGKTTPIKGGKNILHTLMVKEHYANTPHLPYSKIEWSVSWIKLTWLELLQIWKVNNALLKHCIISYLSRSFSIISNMLLNWQNSRTRCWETTGSVTLSDVCTTPIPQSCSSCLENK